MIGLTSSSQVAITSMNNFPCLLMFNFQYTAFFFNIFDREVMSVLDKISTCFLFFLNVAESHTFISYISLILSTHYHFLISNCSWCYFSKKGQGQGFGSRLSLYIIWRRKTPVKLSKTPEKHLENSWNLSDENKWSPW